MGQIFISTIGANWLCYNERTVLNENQQASPKNGTIVYACSGCSDAGELADRIARQLTREGAVEMSCLAGIGGRVKSLVSKANAAERILAIDGCLLNCTRHTLELAAFIKFAHLELHKLGLCKGSCPMTEKKLRPALAPPKPCLQTQCQTRWVHPGPNNLPIL